MRLMGMTAIAAVLLLVVGGVSGELSRHTIRLGSQLCYTIDARTCVAGNSDASASESSTYFVFAGWTYDFDIQTPGHPVAFYRASDNMRYAHTNDSSINGTSSGVVRLTIPIDETEFTIFYRDTTNGFFGFLVLSQLAYCDPGEYLSYEFAASCTPCLPGTFGVESHSRLLSCAACPAATYQPLFNQTDCINCALHANTSICNGTTPCPIGFELGANGECQECYPGVYNNVEGGKCISCAPGSTTNATLSGSSACWECDAGTFSAHGGECVPCAIGTYANSSGASVCLWCPIGRAQSLTGQSSCASCPIATVVGARVCRANGTAVHCVAGSRYVHETDSCADCHYGTFSATADSTFCTSCATGYISDFGHTACTSCAAGTYARYRGSNACALCPGGKFSSGTGASACWTCPAGTYATANSTACTVCTTNLVAGASSCPNGTACVAGNRVDIVDGCVLCLAGTYSATDDSATCTNCATGKFSTRDGATTCAYCAAGSITPLTGFSVCFNCTAGSYAPAGQSSCTQCPVYTWNTQGGQSVCKNCRTASNPAVCNGTIPCAAGQGLETTFGLCESCTYGRYSPVAGSACLPCPAGSTQYSTAATTCDTCSAGRYNPTPGGECPSCPQGTYSAGEGNSACTVCALGTYTDNLNGVSVCARCALGSFANLTAQTTCQDCPLRTYAPSRGLSACWACASANISTGSTSCAEVGSMCDYGTYNNTAEGACWNCASGTYTNIRGATVCQNCSIGTAQSGTAQSSCDQCQPGLFNADVAAASCSYCQFGSYSTSSGATVCIDCAVGKYNPSFGQTTCQVCNLSSEYIVPFPKQTECSVNGTKRCLPGTRVWITWPILTCYPCPWGQYTNTINAVDCLSCGAGTYNGLQTATSCTICPAGKFSNGNGSASCSTCPAGTFQPLTGQTQCDICQYSSAPGSITCSNTTCAAGTRTTATNGTCTQCVVGRYAAYGGSSACTACERGRYAATAGASVCANCSISSYNVGAGYTACALCPPQTYNLQAGSTVCIACAAGQTSPATCTSVLLSGASSVSSSSWSLIVVVVASVLAMLIGTTQ